MAYSQGNRRKLVVLADREGQDTLTLSLLRIQQDILSIETSAAVNSQLNAP